MLAPAVAVKHTESIEVWERQVGEPVEAYKAFVVYRDMRPRDLKRVPDLLSIPQVGGLQITLKTVKGWAARWNWADRVVSWDAELERLNGEQHIYDIMLATERQLKAGKDLQELGLRALLNLAADEVSPELALKFIDLGVKIERLALGMSSKEDAPTGPQQPIRVEIVRSS